MEANVDTRWYSGSNAWMWLIWAFNLLSHMVKSPLGFLSSWRQLEETPSVYSNLWNWTLVVCGFGVLGLDGLRSMLCSEVEVDVGLNGPCFVEWRWSSLLCTCPRHWREMSHSDPCLTCSWYPIRSVSPTLLVYLLVPQTLSWHLMFGHSILIAVDARVHTFTENSNIEFEWQKIFQISVSNCDFARKVIYQDTSWGILW